MQKFEQSSIYMWPILIMVRHSLSSLSLLWLMFLFIDEETSIYQRAANYRRLRSFVALVSLLTRWLERHELVNTGCSFPIRRYLLSMHIDWTEELNDEKQQRQHMQIIRHFLLRKQTRLEIMAREWRRSCFYNPLLLLPRRLYNHYVEWLLKTNFSLSFSVSLASRHQG